MEEYAYELGIGTDFLRVKKEKKKRERKRKEWITGFTQELPEDVCPLPWT